ncbi:hypothetical protein FCJ61_15000 [Burkholderia metallica]|nr:hypothetical protein [Burkholderia metallica]
MPAKQSVAASSSFGGTVSRARSRFRSCRAPFVIGIGCRVWDAGGARILIEKRVKPRPSGRGRKARTPKAPLTTR